MCNYCMCKDIELNNDNNQSSTVQILPNMAKYYQILPNIAKYCHILPHIATYCQFSSQDQILTDTEN